MSRKFLQAIAQTNILYFDHFWTMASVAKELTRRADRGAFGGLERELTLPYFKTCRGVHEPSGTRIGFTRDVGYHSSGWFKNPDYERCYHLSLSFNDPKTGENRDKDPELTKEWLDLFFLKNKNFIWSEPASGEKGKVLDVWHYRLFCNELWLPIKPRGEVYSTELTEIGWKSFSELQEELAQYEPPS